MILSVTSTDKTDSRALAGAPVNQTAVSIFSAVGVVLTLGGLMVTEHNSLRSEINAVRADMTEGQAALRAEMTAGDAALRAAIDGLRSDSREDQAALRAELVEIRSDISDIRVTMSDMGERVARIETTLILPRPD